MPPPSFSITQIPTTYNVPNPTFHYYSNTVKWEFVTINQNTYLNLTANGTPFPAKAGNNPLDLSYGGFVNDEITPLVWVGNPLLIVDQKYNYNIVYRGGTNVGNPQTSGMGILGMFANGVALYSPSSGVGVPLLNNLLFKDTITNQNREFNAIYFEEFYSIDQAGGHCSPSGVTDSSGNQGQYHYHDDVFLLGDGWNNTKFINSNLYFSSDYYSSTNTEHIEDEHGHTHSTIVEQDYTRHTNGHSKILGVCFDGYPVYGRYGYTDPNDSSSNVIAMTSSYQLNPTPFTGRPYSYTSVFNYSSRGQSKQITIGAGAYLNDHTFVSGLGTLDIYNGRYCVTPEYPNGTYAYFTTSTYPYIIGNSSKNQRVSISNIDMLPTGSIGTTNIGMSSNVPCFKEDSKILCYKDNREIYVKIQDIRKGDLVKTLNNGYIPVNMIGTTILYNSGNEIKNPNKLYKCSRNKYPELFEDLYITGYHSILVDHITEYEKEQIIDLLGKVCATDDKYRLLACLDKKTEVCDIEGIFNIWHLALENDDYYMNYGIYANGLLVESSSKRYMKEYSRMILIE